MCLLIQIILTEFKIKKYFINNIFYKTYLKIGFLFQGPKIIFDIFSYEDSYVIKYFLQTANYNL